MCEYHPHTGKKTTYTALAEYLGVKNQSVSQWARGETIPDTKNIAPIANYFGVSCGYVLGVENTPSHSATDICRETGLAPQTVEILSMYAKSARTDEFFGVDKKSDGYFLIKAIDNLVSNCNLTLIFIGQYLFADFDGLDNPVTVRGANITLKEPSEYVRRGYLHALSEKLMNYRKMLLDNGGELPLTGELEETRESKKTSFLKQRIEWLEQQKGSPLTEEEIERQAELWEQGQKPKTAEEMAYEEAFRTVAREYGDKHISFAVSDNLSDEEREYFVQSGETVLLSREEIKREYEKLKSK
jgi:transcriptional regulator with XRE-family HTH domain